MKIQNCIPTPTLKKTIPVLAFVFFGLSHGFSQNNPLDFHFETDSIPVEKGASFLNFLVLENKSDQEITVQDLSPKEKYPGLLLSPQSQYTLAVGEKKRLPIKFLANLNFMKMKSKYISYFLSYTFNDRQKKLKASFAIQRKEEEQLALYSFSHENYINPSVRESTVSLFVENRGYTQRSIQLTATSNPEGLELSPKEVQLSLEGQEKKLVEFKVQMRHQNNFSPDYSIQVKATDLISHKNVGSTYINVIVLSNKKQFLRGAGPENGKNFVEMAYNEQSSSFNYLQFRGNSEFNAGKDIQGRFNTTGNLYLQEDKYNFYDTWLELERKGSRIRLGNVYGNDYGYSLSGRGGKLNTPIGENKEIEVLALENNYNLFGNYFPEQAASKIVAGKYKFGEINNLNGKVSYLFDHNPRLNIDTQVAQAASSFSLDSIHNFAVEAGLSHEKGLVIKEENLGASVAANYETKLKKWDFHSLNSWASKTYAGLNRGAFNFNQTIGYQLSNKQRIFGRYQNAQVHPEYLTYQNTNPPGNQGYDQYYYYSTQIAQTGIQFSTSQWNFLVSPEFEKQKNNNTFLENELTAYRFRTRVGTSFNKHSLDLSAQYSYSKAKGESDWFNSWKATLSYRYSGFSLNGSAQVNPHDVIDLKSYNFGNKKFFNYNVYSAYSFQVFKNSLSGSVAAGINYSELYQNTNQHINGNVEYKIAQSWAATGYANYATYKSTGNYGYKGNNYQFRIGIKKYFIKTTASGNHKVNLQLFHDKNFNGIFDADEIAMANEVVYLNDFIAITDKNGKVTFQNVPKGSYKLKVNETQGLRLRRDPVIVVESNENLKLGLVKNNKVTGKLVEVRQKYDLLETDVRGVVIYAKDSQGEVYSTVVNQNNEFEFFLSSGLYTIYIENNKYDYLNAVQKIKVENANYPEALIFKYKKKNTEIKVKKF
ncbi:MAG: hypothetical protein L0J63_05440 [Tetragenococcus koreensis]|nr:hypothetical protein [Tetragenococcus koreensis]